MVKISFDLNTFQAKSVVYVSSMKGGWLQNLSWDYCRRRNYPYFKNLNSLKTTALHLKTAFKDCSEEFVNFQNLCDIKRYRLV